MIDLVQAEIIEWLTAYVRRVEKGQAPRFHAAFGDPPYSLSSIVKRFGKPDAKPAKQGKDGAFARQSRGFMGQEWDGFESPLAFQQWVTEWATLMTQCMLPGALAAFYGGTRTAHRLACGLEDAGLEVFDVGIYLYGTGMPHSHNIERDFQVERRGWRGKAISNQAMLEMPLAERAELLRLERSYAGYGTLLKPAYEPIILARFPRGKLTFAQCAQQFGTGALNVDGGRVGVEQVETGRGGRDFQDTGIYGRYEGQAEKGTVSGRWPANVTLDERAAELLDEQTGESESVRSNRGEHADIRGGNYNRSNGKTLPGSDSVRGYEDSGGASRFFYSSKAPAWEREAGLGGFAIQDGSIGDRRKSGSMSQRIHKDTGRPDTKRRNVHPTVKPILQSEYWSRLLLPPPGPEPRRLLNPFSGSGSELIGANFAGWDVITGVEMGAEYAEIARARCAWWSQFASYKEADDARRVDSEHEKQAQRDDAPGAFKQLSFLD